MPCITITAAATKDRITNWLVLYYTHTDHNAMNHII